MHFTFTSNENEFYMKIWDEIHNPIREVIKQIFEMMEKCTQRIIQMENKNGKS